MRRTSGWVGVAGILAGGLAGIATGIAARLAMRGVALSEQASVALIQSPEGELVPSRIPVFTMEGTLAVIIPVVFVGLFLGLILTLTRLSVFRTLSPSRRVAWYSALMLATIGAPFYASTSEFDVGVRAVGIIGFASAFVVFAAVFEIVMVAGENRMPRLFSDDVARRSAP